MQRTVVRTAHRIGRPRTILLSSSFTPAICRKTLITKSTSGLCSADASRTERPTTHQDTNSFDWHDSTPVQRKRDEDLSGTSRSPKYKSSRNRKPQQEFDLTLDSFPLSGQLEDSPTHNTSTCNRVSHQDAEFHPTDEDLELKEDVWEQAPNPPLPASPPNPHPVDTGISGSAAAISYLRARGLANTSKKATFYYLLCWTLRHAARDLGFQIVPDGFVRILDLLHFEPFQTYTLETFARACIDDRFDRFEVMSLPDVVNGRFQEIWWVRARACQTISGVLPSNKRIINMGRLQTVVYRAPLEEWPKIRRHGIREGPERIIRLYGKDAGYFGNIIPHQSRYVCITIDAQKAADMGVMFFHTHQVDLLAVGKNGVIPVDAIRSVVELEITKKSLTWT